MPNMTKQYRTELRALKKKAAALEREEKCLASNASRALRKNAGALQKIVRDANRLAAGESKRIEREFRIEKKRIVSETTAIGTRIGILEGRIAQ